MPKAAKSQNSLTLYFLEMLKNLSAAVKSPSAKIEVSWFSDAAYTSTDLSPVAALIGHLTDKIAHKQQPIPNSHQSVHLYRHTITAVDGTFTINMF
ncbi:hypothetical protein ACTXT7_006502 [Hymenolepis weldensis]